MIWTVSIKQAFITLNHNRKLIGIALISVVFGKIIDLIEQFTDRTLYEVIAASVKTEALRHAFEMAQVGRFDETLRVFDRMEYLNLEQPQFLMTVVGLVIGAFLIAFYNDTGLAALIRDLLMKSSYRSVEVITYGQVYFKPAFLFKGSFYIGSAVVIILMSPVLFFLYQLLAAPIFGWAVIGLCVLPLFVVYISFLSLGMKFIVIEGEYRAQAIYRRTKSFILDNITEVSACFSFDGVGDCWFNDRCLLSYGQPTPVSYQLLVKYFSDSYVTVLLKITSFVFYLRIRDG